MMSVVKGSCLNMPMGYTYGVQEHVESFMGYRSMLGYRSMFARQS